MLDKDPRKDKLGQRSVKGIFVGYPRERRVYRFQILDELWSALTSVEKATGSVAEIDGVLLNVNIVL